MLKVMKTSFKTSKKSPEEWMLRCEKLKSIANEVDSSLMTVFDDVSMGTQKTVLVVGEFNSGKSTLCNALVQRAGLIPTDVVENTRFITEIRVGDREVFERVDITGDQKLVNEISKDEFRRLTTKAENADNVDRLRVLIHKGSNGLLDNPNVVLVDSPGLVSLDESRALTTLNYLPRADAIILVIDATKGLRGSHLNFLKNLTENESQLLLLVLNCIDRTNTDDDKKEVLSNTIAQADQLGIPALSILPVSALQAVHALERGHAIPETSGIAKLTCEIAKIIKQNQDTIAAAQIERPVRIVANKLLARFSGEMDGLKTAPEQLERKLRGAQNAYDNQRQALEGFLEKSRIHIDSEMAGWGREANDTFQRLRQFLHGKVDSVGEIQALRALIQEGIIDARIGQAARSLVIKAERCLESAFRQIGSDIQQGIPVFDAPEPFSITQPGSPILKIPIEVILSIVDKLVILVPGGLFVKLAACVGGSYVLKALIELTLSGLLADQIRDDIKKSIDDILSEVEKELGDWVENTVSASFDVIRQEVDQRGEAAMEGLRMSESRVKEGSEVINRRCSEIGQHINTLRELIS
jgi:GTPase Era involved in 16S rRNA processing